MGGQAASDALPHDPTEPIRATSTIDPVMAAPESLTDQPPVEDHSLNALRHSQHRRSASTPAPQCHQTDRDQQDQQFPNSKMCRLLMPPTLERRRAIQNWDMPG